MKTLFKQLLLASLLAGALAGAPSLAAADAPAKPHSPTTSPTKEAAVKGTAKRTWYPFAGTVSSVDQQANAITLKKKQGERVLKLDAKTTLEIDGKPATLGSVKVGDYAHGRVHKDSAGHEVITSAKFDKEPPKKQKNAVDKESGKAHTPKPAK